MEGAIEERAGQVIRVRRDTRSFEDLDGGKCAPMPGRRIHVGHARDGGVHRGLQERVAAGLVQGRDEEGQRFVGPVDVQDVAEGQEGVRPARAARDLVEDDAEPHLRPVRVTGGEGCLGRLDEIGGPDVGRLGHAGSLVEQVGGDARRAASEGDPSGVPERLGDRCVASLDRRREVDGALDGVVDHLGQGGVEGTAFARRGIGDGDRGVQGMRRPEARTVGDEDALFAGRVDRPVAPVTQDALRRGRGSGRPTWPR